ncbi:MAG: hypothetical protein ACK4E4_05060 [Rhodocyclaceae bacterium]
MSSRLKSFLLILVALWLPIQAAAAVTMPFCHHAAQSTPTATETATEAAPCHGPAAKQVSFALPGDLDCDDCSLCHLVCSGFLLVPAVVTAAPPMADILVPKRQLVSASHIPEPHKRPPRRQNV